MNSEPALRCYKRLTTKLMGAELGEPSARAEAR
jgi:hypothetical protein